MAIRQLLRAVSWLGFRVAVAITLLAGAIVALAGPRMFRGCTYPRAETAQTRAGLFVQAHQEWSLNDERECPDSLFDLLEFMNSKSLDDPWGSAYRMVCGDDAPDGVPFGVVSAGPDGELGTPDDIKSWEYGNKKRKYED